MRFTSNLLRAAACAGILALGAPAFSNPLQDRQADDAQRTAAVQYGRRIPAPQAGAIAALRRGEHGGLVDVVSGIDANGNPIVVPGNHKTVQTQ